MSALAIVATVALFVISACVVLARIPYVAEEPLPELPANEGVRPHRDYLVARGRDVDESGRYDPPVPCAAWSRFEDGLGPHTFADAAVRHRYSLMASDWARDLLEAGDFVTLDSETTGLGRGESRISVPQFVELAVVEHDGTPDVLSFARVRPTIPVEAEALAVHDSSDELLRSAASYELLHPLVVAALSGRRVVVFNAAFDRRIYAAHLDDAPLHPEADARFRGEAPVLAPQNAEIISPGVSLTEARNGRPKALSVVTRKLTTGHGPIYVSMNGDEFGPRECFVILGKPGGTASAFSDALGRMISLAMTHGASPAELVHQLRGIQDGHPAGVGLNAVLSVPDGVAKAMSEHYLSVDAEANESQPALPIAGACPDCGGELRRESGCDVCTTGGCGYQRCS